MNATATLCQCGCDRPALHGKWHNAMCLKRWKRHGKAVPMAKCAKCGNGLSANAKGDGCGRCENVDATAGHRRSGVIATLAKALGARERFPFETSTPDVQVSGFHADEAESAEAKRLRNAECGYIAVTCPKCGEPGWEEPVLTRVVNGVTTTEKVIRCAARNRPRCR